MGQINMQDYTVIETLRILGYLMLMYELFVPLLCLKLFLGVM